MTGYAFEFYLLNPDGSSRAPLPDVGEFSISFELNTPGAVEFTYPVDGANWGQLHEFVRLRQTGQIRVRWGSGINESFRALVLKASFDQIGAGSTVRYGGYFYEYRLAKTVVWAQNTGTREIFFTDATAGQIVKILVGQAQERGALTDIVHASFGDTLDSNGLAWNNLADVKFSPGTTYLAALEKLYEIGLCEYEMRFESSGALHLRLYLPGTRGVDRTTDTSVVEGSGLYPGASLYPGPELFPSDVEPPRFVFQAGRDLVDVPTTYDASNRVSALLLGGASAVYALISDPATTETIGWREEGYASQGNVTTERALLEEFGQYKIQIAKEPDYEVTCGITLDDDSPLPMRDFGLTDWVYVDIAGDLEKMQILQWTITRDGGTGQLKGTITCGTRIDDMLLRLARKIASAADGSIILGTSHP